MELVAVFPSLLAFLFVGLMGRQITDRAAQFITCAAVILAAFASCVLFFDVILGDDPRIITLARWISSGDFQVNWTLRVDSLSVVMMCVINIISACVHVYSIGYMAHDPSKSRFMAYLSLFTFAMLMLVSADNMVQLFFGWEGVGLASYLLIGFWNVKPSANAAAVKAFVVNRIGDFGLALGIMATFAVFGTVEFDPIFARAEELSTVNFMFLGQQVHALTLICLLLFIGACGKSAQLGLHTWLPDAMEGPTPVSALIHAATMVTAGVFLVARFSPVFEYAPVALMVVCLVGAVTAFVAATIAVTQTDIKRVIAYSTMSQLGYMFFALGVSAYPAAMFHLTTHAFFKALLFLGAGSVIHAMSDEQDMRKMGGIWKLIPSTYILMWIGSLALAGIPLFAGFYSKDIILEAAFADHTWFGTLAYWLGVAAAFMTAFYSWRLILMTFHGKPRASKEVMSHVHESPSVMLSPLIVLAVGAIFSGSVLYGGFVGTWHGDDHGGAHEMEVVVTDVEAEHHEVDAPHVNEESWAEEWDKEHFWDESILVLDTNDTVEEAHNVPKWVKYLPLLMALLGIALAYMVYFFREGVAEKLARTFKPLYILSFNKWFFDEIYQKLFVENMWRIGNVFSRKGDQRLIDGLGPNGLAWLSQKIAAGFSRVQTGYMYHYALVMMIGLIGLVTWFIYTAGL